MLWAIIRYWGSSPSGPTRVWTSYDTNAYSARKPGSRRNRGGVLPNAPAARTTPAAANANRGGPEKSRSGDEPGRNGTPINAAAARTPTPASPLTPENHTNKPAATPRAMTPNEGKPTRRPSGDVAAPPPARSTRTRTVTAEAQLLRSTRRPSRTAGGGGGGTSMPPEHYSLQPKDVSRPLVLRLTPRIRPLSS